MSRDYKSTRSRGSGGLSGTAGLLLGLAIGLGVAMAVFIYDHRPSTAGAQPQAGQNAARSERERAEDEAADDSSKQFDFYEMLPKFEVVVPEREKAVSNDARPNVIERPGAYVLQAGSYRNFADADRVRAQLALQGIESKIQRVSIDKDTWHRVRIGPMKDLAELNRTRERLRQSDVEAIVVRVGD